MHIKLPSKREDIILAVSIIATVCGIILAMVWGVYIITGEHHQLPDATVLMTIQGGLLGSGIPGLKIGADQRVRREEQRMAGDMPNMQEPDYSEPEDGVYRD